MLGMWRPNFNEPIRVQRMWTLTAVPGLAVRACLAVSVSSGASVLVPRWPLGSRWLSGLVPGM